MPRVHCHQQHAMEHFGGSTLAWTHSQYASTPNSAATTPDSVLQCLGFDPHLLSTAVLHRQLHYLRTTGHADVYPLDLSLKTLCKQEEEDPSAPITPPCTPSPHKLKEPPDQESGSAKKAKLGKKVKATRRLHSSDEDNSSPVSGTIIRELRPDETLVVRKGDIDPAFNVVEVTEEAKAELAKIENLIGDYVCRLCRELYEDAFGLAQHRCSRIVHVEYRCPECDKVFNCPANLASHRRWHKPRGGKEQTTTKLGDEVDLTSTVSESDGSSSGGGEQFPCHECGKKFRRVAYLRKHQTLHQIE